MGCRAAAAASGHVRAQTRAPMLQALTHMRGARPRRCLLPGEPERFGGHQRKVPGCPEHTARARELRSMLSGLQHALPARFGNRKFDISGLQAAEAQTSALAVIDTHCPVFQSHVLPLPARGMARGAQGPAQGLRDSELADVLTAASDERCARAVQAPPG